MLLAIIILRDYLSEAYVTVFEDKTPTERQLVKGMSRCLDINTLLSVFWGSAAAQRARFWFEHIGSSNNPADCLTKPGLCCEHLQNVTDVSAEIARAELFARLVQLLSADKIPAWDQIQSLSAFRLNSHFR